jgi:hypothetical protein
MEWEKFVEKKSTKFKTTGSKNLDYLYCSINISTEIADLISAFVQAKDKIIKIKIGNICHHLATLEHVIGRNIIDLPAGATQTLYMDEWMIGHQELISHCRDVFFHNKEPDVDFIHSHNEQCKAIIKGMCYSNTIPLDSILEDNLNQYEKI